MTRINLNNVEIRLTLDHNLEVTEKDKKITRCIYSDEVNRVLKKKDSLTFWNKFCQWTLGLFGKKWDDYEIKVLGKPTKEYCICKKALAELLAEKSEKPYQRTHQSTFAKVDKSSSNPTNVSGMATSSTGSPINRTSPARSKQSNILKQTQTNPIEEPNKKPEVAKDVITEEKVTNANDFISLRKLIIDLCKLDDNCKEPDLVNKLRSKLEAGKFQNKNEKFNWETLQTKYESYAIPILDTSISVINDTVNSQSGQDIRNLICDILKLPRNVDEDNLKKNIKDMKDKIDSLDETQRPAAFYYFKNLINAKKEYYKEASKNIEAKLNLCHELNLPQDISDEALKKACQKNRIKLHPDKFQRANKSEEEIAQATKKFQHFEELYQAYFGS